jgi:hypothetical protein
MWNDAKYSYAAEIPLNTPAKLSGVLCEECDQATLAAALIQEQRSVDNQANATAEIVRSNAQATLSAANATLNAVQTQEQSDINVVAAQIASTAEMERANAQATLNSAGATQSAALTQDSIQQTQMANLATTSAEALAVQQNKDELAVLVRKQRLQIILPRKPRLRLRHHNGIPTRNVNAKSKDKDQLLSCGCGAFRPSFYCLRVSCFGDSGAGSGIGKLISLFLKTLLKDYQHQRVILGNINTMIHCHTLKVTLLMIVLNKCGLLTMSPVGSTKLKTNCEVAIKKMKIMNPTIEPHHYQEEARRIRKKTSTILNKWGLLPRFKRWRLTQDPDTGMIVLFGILNSRYIAMHTSIPFSNYFDTNVLDDLESNTQLQVVSCNSDGGLRYAFVLARGSLGKIPTHIDIPITVDGKPLIRVVYGDPPQPVAIPVPPIDIAIGDDQALVRQGVGAFLKVFDDIQLKDEAAQTVAQNPPEIVVIEKDEFNKRVAEHEAIR